MQVLEDNQERPAVRNELEEAPHSPEDLCARRSPLGGARRGAETLEHDVAVLGLGEESGHGLDAAQVRDELLKWPERDAGPVREAAPGRDVRDVFEPRGELACEPGLPDPRSPQQHDDAAAALLECLFDQRTK